MYLNRVYRRLIEDSVFMYLWKFRGVVLFLVVFLDLYFFFLGEFIGILYVLGF